MTMQDVRTPSVRKDLTVPLPPDEAFRLFTEGIGGWWPGDTHRIGGADAVAHIEPREGGRWFERAADGTESDWGRVLAWEPPGRLVLAWQIDQAWRHDPALVTEVEITFSAQGDGTTRVDLEHRDLDRYGDAAAAAASTLGGEGGWPMLLDRYAAAASGA